MSREQDANYEHVKYMKDILGDAHTTELSLESKASEHTAGVRRLLVLLEHYIGVVHDRIGQDRLFGLLCRVGAGVDVVHRATNNRLSAGTRLSEWDLRRL